MPVYHQMGHQSDNLLLDSQLQSYAGAILSPVNYDLATMSKTVNRYRANGNPEAIFDSQIYYPRTEVEKLRSWSYFPNNFDTLDPTSDQWWIGISSALATNAQQVGATAVCSPAMVPKAFVPGYYSQIVKGAEILQDLAAPRGLETLQTVLVRLSDLTNQANLYSIASIVTRTKCTRVYLVLLSEVEPRRELQDVEELKAAMLFIHTLETAGVRVLVGFSSSDMILWKAAGATACATGKFWNLRRFTPSRWDPEEGGGGQLSYWMEEGLLACVRESDVLRLARANLLSEASTRNPFSHLILQAIEQGNAWVGLGWRHFLAWFADAEARIQSGTVTATELLRNADQTWETMEDRSILMEERRNDGRWVRYWRIALAEYQQP